MDYLDKLSKEYLEGINICDPNGIVLGRLCSGRELYFVATSSNAMVRIGSMFDDTNAIIGFDGKVVSFQPHR